jgi:hypothetical protein
MARRQMGQRRKAVVDTIELQAVPKAQIGQNIRQAFIPLEIGYPLAITLLRC